MATPCVGLSSTVIHSMHSLCDASLLLKASKPQRGGVPFSLTSRTSRSIVVALDGCQRFSSASVQQKPRGPAASSASRTHRSQGRTHCQVAKHIPAASADSPTSEDSQHDKPDGALRRRQLAAYVAASVVPLSLGGFREGTASAVEAEAVDQSTVGRFEDAINAYEFNYPLGLPDSSTRFNWAETRKPERYSSAAPLSADARQRIVSERLDFRNNLVVSVSVGPPNPAFLRGDDPKAWSAMAVARSVIADKSTARLSPEQRAQEVSIDEAVTREVNGDTYWFYEYLAQKSPTNFANTPDVYRHSLAVSAAREGYIYTLNVSTLDSNWPKMEESLRAAVNSFHFTAPTNQYVPPWKDPWRFW
eukprot:TRINITY_DN29802_c0_g1_i1.p1 TRINITY_DN29802_c0_g1~~TRINITY_DN29802_c0_g1_i1.p1  ORF type:complete len:361 (+),score=28.30 TRINITY_DN29802_c0_g1_i1:63-1145(+)